MIQFNLLPDVKLQYVKAQRMKRRVTVGAVSLSIAALTVLLFMIITVNVIQKKSLSDLNADIKTYSSKLKSIEDLSSILTVQNQLNTLPGLHDDKVVASRVFTYLNQLTPAKATLARVSVSFADGTMSINGAAPSLDVVNTYTDTLKATTFKRDDSQVKAFSNVVLTSFGRNADETTYTIDFKFDPAIFDNNQTITLTVPAGSTADPAALFQKAGN